MQIGPNGLTKVLTNANRPTASALAMHAEIQTSSQAWIADGKTLPRWERCLGACAKLVGLSRAGRAPDKR
eukprot:7142244-Lingulodinium_polyedra.AAC.1